MESFSDNYDYSSDSDFEVDDEEAKPVKIEERRAVAKETQLEDGMPAALDSDKYGYILRFEKEDAQSETSGMSASEMESALAEFEDTKYVRPSPVPPRSDLHNLVPSNSTVDLRRVAKIVVMSDVAFVT